MRLTVLVVAFALLLMAVGVAAAFAVAHSWLANLPDYISPTAFEVPQATKIYSADGKLLARLYLQNRDVVPMSQIATSLADGVVAVEDENYYQDGAIDPEGILRAAVTDIMTGHVTQGGSTITQQFVRNTILLSERTDMTLQRKLREAYLAVQVANIYTKNQILEMYLNTVYFGQGAYGAQTAAETYFGTTANKLTLPEGALLAGLVQLPSELDPYRDMAAAVARRNDVLSRMLINHYISQTAYAAAIAAPVVLKDSEPADGIYAAPYFVSYVKTLLQQLFPPTLVFQGGLSVYTTLDTRLQSDAEHSAYRKFSVRNDPEVALVAIDPRNGWVKAMVGGRNYHTSKFNLATQAYRQPGSSFKTFVLVTALSQGMPPSFQVDSNAPAIIPSKSKPWVVDNDEGTGSGMMPLNVATWNSVNAVFARVAWGIGIKNVIRTAHRMGITTYLPNYPSIALGSVGVTPLQMASAYSTLPADGVYHSPVVITKVVDETGNTIYQDPSQARRAISPSIAHATIDVLKGVIQRGTATAANIGRPEAGKTGTSQLNHDCWFIGFTPQLCTAVWVGYPKEERTIIVDGSRGFGGTVAAPIWASFMRKALSGKPAQNFPYAPEPSYDPSRFHLLGSSSSVLKRRSTGGSGSSGSGSSRVHEKTPGKKSGGGSTTTSGTT